jgi:hypothetical protein
MLLALDREPHTTARVDPIDAECSHSKSPPIPRGERTPWALSLPGVQQSGRVGKPMSSGQEILAQDEIDALIHGIGNGAVPTEAPPARDEARQYNFSHNTRIVRGRMPTLEMINERFGRLLRTSIYNLAAARARHLGGFGADPQVCGVRAQAAPADEPQPGEVRAAAGHGSGDSRSEARVRARGSVSSAAGPARQDRRP